MNGDPYQLVFSEPIYYPFGFLGGVMLYIQHELDDLK
jgi:hypothetical protein